MGNNVLFLLVKMETLDYLISKSIPAETDCIIYKLACVVLY